MNRARERNPATSRVFPLLAALALASAFLLGLSGCTGGATQQPPQAQVPPAVEPAPPALDSPESAVRSYLEWTSYAYRLLESDVSSPTASPEHQVRVDSYVELNRQKGRAIEQTLTAFEVKKATTKGDSATIVAVESWSYRYIDTKTVTYSSPSYEAIYDTTYKLTRDPKRKEWVVDGVEPKPRGKVK